MTDRNGITRVLLYLTLVLLLWAGISLLPGPKQEIRESSDASFDMRAESFDDAVYALDPAWESWPGKLYDPQGIPVSEQPLSSRDLDATPVDYATYRLTLSLQPETSYGISLSSSKYAVRLFVDDTEALSVGTPGTTREETVPRESRGIHFFTPSQEKVEVVAQVANFVHADGGQPPAITIGAQNDIMRLERETDIRSSLITGSLVAAFLFHLGIFLLNSRQKASLLFAVFCLVLAIQPAIPIVYLLPSYDWLTVTRIEYLSNLGALIVLLLLIKMVFPKAMGDWVYRVYISLSALYCLAVLFTDSSVFTLALPLFQVFAVGLALYILIQLALTLREKNLKNILAFTGLLLMGVCGIGDVLFRNGLLPYDLVGRQVINVGTGAMLLVFCYVMVLAIEQSETNKRVEDMRRELAQSEERYAMLVEKKQGTETLTNRLADFGLTKREREVASLLLNGKSREEIASLLFVSIGTINTHCTNVYKKVGCGSVGELAHHVNPDWFT